MMRTVSLAEMAVGREGVVREFVGGLALARKMEAMGMRPGARFIKTSGSSLRAPVTLRTGNVQLALGYGMACKVMVEVRGQQGDRHRA